MKILVVGGTGLVGSHITRNLLELGHDVTIATRGKRNDGFGSQVSRITFDRLNPQEISAALADKLYDVIYDTQAYSSNEIKYLLDYARCKRYIEVSTVSVYAPDFSLNLPEENFDPTTYPLNWCGRKDFPYDEIKRQAECAMFQTYSHIPSVAVRLPFVIGTDDDTRRLHFYVEHILSQKPMHINNLDAELSFVRSDEAGRFIAWLADKDICGPVNAGSRGTITLAEITAYVERKTGISAILQDDGDNGAYNHCPSFSMSLDKTGFEFSSIKDWIYDLLDELIRNA